MTPPVVAVDHFAGTGWGVACRWLDIHEYGVEIMPEAIRTRTRAGMRTIYRDVWAGLHHPGLVPLHRLYTASPPCQTFSIAGRGTGRKALEQVLALVREGVWKNPAALKASGAALGDDRTALVLTPLAHIWAHRPELVALEQVPTVLPVWEAVAVVLRDLGYSVWVGKLHAEQYGVPQTRTRAILIARADGIQARPPAPTHSRYYSREPERLDVGVQKWISMAEALGWGMTARPYPTVATGTENGGTDPAALGGSGARRTVYAERADGRWAASGDVDNDGGILRLTADNAATIQSYPAWAFDRPATTVAGDSRIWAPGHKVNGSDIARLGDEAAREKYGDRAGTGAYRATVHEAAALQSYPQWVFERPAPTLVGTRRSEDGMLVGRQLDDGSRRDVGGRQTSVGLRPGSLPGVRVSGEEGAALQSYPRPFPFQGSRGKQFLQIGNAVPPLLARSILGELVAPAHVATSPWDDVFAEVAR